jgi:hypothetical protein
VHANPKAETGCQGIFYHPAIAHYGVVAPGQADLGYYKEVKQAALVFSRYVAGVAAELGKKYSSRPWPRAEKDDRRFHRISLGSCKVDSTRKDYDKRMGAAVEVAEWLYELIGHVESFTKTALEDGGATTTAVTSTTEPAESSSATALVPAGSLDVADTVPVAHIESIGDLKQAQVVVAVAELRTGYEEVKKKGKLKDDKEKKEKKMKPVVLNDYCDPILKLVPGELVEVRQKDNTGFDGAWYMATIKEVLPKGTVRVQYTSERAGAQPGARAPAAAASSSSAPMEVEGGEEDVKRLWKGTEEDVKISNIRPVPPVLTGENGAPLELIPGTLIDVDCH